MTLMLADLVEAALRADAERLGAQGRGGRLRVALAAEGVSIIAEIKGASPLGGTLRDPFDPREIGRDYEKNGAAAISVLTEEHFFAGSVSHLETVSTSVLVPTLRKDFVVEHYQVFRAATAGASAVLLIAELLEGSALQEFVAAAHSVGLDALVEFHRPSLLVPAVEAGSGIVGINNRNLDSMEVDAEHALRLAAELPPAIVAVAESAVADSAAVRRVAAAGFDAALVGTALMTAAQPGELLAEMVAAGRPDGAPPPDGPPISEEAPTRGEVPTSDEEDA